MRVSKQSGYIRWAYLFLTIIISVAITGCVQDDDNGYDEGISNGNGDVVVMNSMELRYDWNPYRRGFDSLKSGDTLYLEDTIKEINIEGADTYLDLGYITVKVLGTEIKNKVNVYDKIRITLTVIKEKYKYDEIYGGYFETYFDDLYRTYDFEWFKQDLNGFGGGIVIESKNIREI